MKPALLLHSALGVEERRSCLEDVEKIEVNREVVRWKEDGQG